MTTFGNSLRTAREAKGLTISQIAESTHITSAILQGLENGDFSAIPAPIYGRGFVKLYCEAVDLDPTPMIAAFMDEFNSEPAATAPQQSVLSPNIAEPPPVEPEPSSAPMPPPATDLPVDKAPPSECTQPSLDFSRYSSPTADETSIPDNHIPLPWGRWLVIIIIAVLVIWGGLVAMKALYRATSENETAIENEDLHAAKTAETVNPKKAATPVPVSRPKRTPQDIPPLYVDQKFN